MDDQDNKNPAGLYAGTMEWALWCITWSYQGGEKKEKEKEKVEQAIHCYTEQDMIYEDFKYLFVEDSGELCKKSSQYLGKWLETVELVDKMWGKEMAYTEHG